MLFDFKRFGRFAATVYSKESPYSLSEYLDVFRTYFQTYEEYMGHPHPPIRASQIARIMQDMPWVDEIGRISGGCVADISPDTYKNIVIPLHFKTKYRHCDYNINHFFSGRIRELRLYEAEKGYE